jgi:Apea-like HEPN
MSRFLEFWNFIRQKDIHNGPLNLALNRFNGAYGKFLPEDKIIDYAISFEALFSGNGVESVAHRLALRVSRLIDQQIQSRKQVYRAVKRLYNKRNEIVHGRDQKSQATDIKDMESYLRRAITAYLRKDLSHNELIDQLDYG